MRVPPIQRLASIGFGGGSNSCGSSGMGSDGGEIVSFLEDLERCAFFNDFSFFKGCEGMTAEGVGVEGATEETI